MLRNRKLLGILLSIVMVLAFSVGGFAYYEYTQESGTNFFVSAADKADALEDTNEMRQILDDLGNLLGHSKRDDSYPKDLTTGGDIDINRITAKTGVATLTTGEAGFVKVSAAAGYSLTLPTAVGNKLTYIFVKTDDNANLITVDGHASETINGSLTYTDLNYQYAYVAIRSDNANWYVLFRSRPIGIADDNLVEIDHASVADDDFAKFTANGLEGRSYSEVKQDLDVDDLENLTNRMDSPGIVTGGEVTEGTTGTFTVAAITAAYLRASASATAVLMPVTLAIQSNQVIAAADTTYYVIFTYGSPCTITSSITAPNGYNAISLGKVMKDTSDNVHYVSGGFRLGDGVAKLWKRAKALRDIELMSGNSIAYSGTNNFTMTEGKVYAGGNLITQAIYDSASTTFTTVYTGYVEGNSLNGVDIAFVDGGAGEDTITRTAADFVTNGYVVGDTLTVSGSTSNDGSYAITGVVAGTLNMATGSLTAEVAGDSVTLTVAKKKIDFGRYDNAGTLTAVANNKYGCYWVYRHVDDGDVYVRYGVDSYTLGDAETAEEPAKPTHLTDFGCLIGKIIAPKAGGSFTAIWMDTDRHFTGTAVSDHANLSNLDYTSSGHTDFQQDITNIVLCSNYDHPDDAITAIASANKTLLVTEAETCDTNFTVPANVIVKFERGGKWTINGTGGSYLTDTVAVADLDDATIGGTFSGGSDTDYKIEIDGAGTPDTFKWSDDGGSTWDATLVAIDGTAQALNNGVTVTFGATTGHTLGDYWTFSGCTGIVVTFNGQIDAGLWQIFVYTGTGVLAGTPKIDKAYPQWWGAVGDGSTDDTIEIQSAINFTDNIYFPSTPTNKYHCTAEITLLDNTYLYFVPGVELKSMRSEWGDFITATSKSNIKIENLRITEEMSCEAYLLFDNCDNVLVDNMHSTASPFNAIFVDGSSNVVIQNSYFSGGCFGVSVTDGDHITVIRCETYNHQRAGLRATHGCSSVYFMYNKIVKAMQEFGGDGAIDCYGGALVNNNIYVVGNIISETGQVENGYETNIIRVTDTNNYYFLNNIITDSPEARCGIEIQDRDHTGCKNIFIEGNIFNMGESEYEEGWIKQAHTDLENFIIKNNLFLGTNTGAKLIYLRDSSKNVLIEGNIVDLSGLPYTFVLVSPDITMDGLMINNNQVRLTASDYILRFQSGTDITINNNVFNIGTNTHGIQLDAGVSNVVVVDNIINATNPTISGTVEVNRHNIINGVSTLSIIADGDTTPSVMAGEIFTTSANTIHIDPVTLTGTGLDDATSGGTFTGGVDLNYKVEIDGTGTPDTFKWADGAAWDDTLVEITGSPQTLSNGVTVTFEATTGHTLGDYWKFTAYIAATEITDLDEPIVGRIVTLIGGSDTASSTITDGGNFNLSSNWVADLDNILILYIQADNDYIEMGRKNLDSDNLSDVASIAMLDENEDITGAWIVSTGSIAGVDATEFGYVDGVTSDIQTQFGLRYLKTEMDSSSELAGIIGDETGTGELVFGTSPTITSSLYITRTHDNSGYDPVLSFQRKRDGDPSDDVSEGDNIGEIRFRGYHTDGYDKGALIVAFVDGTPGNTDMPGRLEFYTSPDGSATPVLRKAIDNAGNHKMGDGVWTNYVNVSAGGAMTAEGTATIDGVGAGNLVDKTASETISGTWTFTNGSPTLLSTTTVAFNADADTTLYTVPTGKRCVLSHAIVVAAGDAGATTTVSIGQNTAETDFVPANTLSNLDAQYDSVILQPIPNTTPLKIKSYAATTVIEAQVASQSGVAGNTIYLFGILY